MDYALVTFASTYGAIRAQEALRPAVKAVTMPVLREISLGCGIALRLAPGDLAAARAALAGCELAPAEYAFYAVTGSGPALRAEKLD